jgi:glycerophosphoryl diester phosphodiesterase
MLEFDVRPTADGTLVLLHDATLERTTGDSRLLAEVHDAELHPRVPRLTDVLQRYAGRARFLVELKDPLPEYDAQMAVLLAGRDAIVQSFDHAALARLVRRAPCLPLAALYGGPPALDQLPPGVTSISPAAPLVDAELLLAARARGLEVRAWTVNDEAEARRLASLGVDGLITDVPDRVRASLAGEPALAAA